MWSRHQNTRHTRHTFLFSNYTQSWVLLTGIWGNCNETSEMRRAEFRNSRTEGRNIPDVARSISGGAGNRTSSKKSPKVHEIGAQPIISVVSVLVLVRSKRFGTFGLRLFVSNSQKVPTQLQRRRSCKKIAKKLVLEGPGAFGTHQETQKNMGNNIRRSPDGPRKKNVFDNFCLIYASD